nr:hypothetical protein [Tanacetum cinerariifolium]
VVLSSMESLKRMVHVTNILSAGYLTTQQMVFNSPYLTHIKNWLVQIKRSLSLLVQKQTALGKDKSNSFIVDSLLKTIWSSIHHFLINEVLTIPGQMTTGDDDEVHDGGVPAAGNAAEGDISAANDEIPNANKEPSIPSPTPPTPPLQPSQDIPSTSQRVKKLERRNKVTVLKLRRLQKVGTGQRIETFNDTVMDDVSNQGRMIAKMDQDVDVVMEETKEVADDVKDESEQDQGKKAKSQAEIYKIDLEHAQKVLSIQEDESKPTEVQEVVEVITTAKSITKVVTTASTVIIAANTTITDVKAQVPAATLTAAPSRVIAAPSRRRK